MQWQATGFPAQVAREVIQKELGAPVEHFFDGFDDKPLAAASIAQVHRARLKDGTQVVVKVMRPNSDKTFLDDMAFFGRVVALASRFRFLDFVKLDEVVWELEQMMREETDFRFELSNLKRMRRQLRKHRIYIPKPYGRYSTRRVLVMEYLPGVLMSDYIRVRDTDPERASAWVLENNIKVKRAGLRLYCSFLRQVFEENRFHGDLHPGNIMLLANSRLALIDLGTISSIERNVLRKYTYMIKAIARQEFEKAVDLLLTLVPELPVADLQPTREDMIRSLRAWAIRTPIRSIPYHEKSLMRGLIDVLRIMAENRMMITWSFLRIIRSRGNMATSLSYLVPQVDQVKLYRRYFKDRERRGWRQITRPRTIRRMIASIPDTINEYRLFVTPMIRRASRMFVGSTSKLDDVAEVVFGLFFRAFVASMGVFVPLYLQAYHPQVLGFVPWLERFLHQLPGFVTLSQGMSQYPQVIWLAGIGIDVYLLLKARSIAKRMGDDNIRLPDNDRA